MSFSIDDCKEYILKLNKEYLDKHLLEQERDELIYENNIETRDVKGYHGREIFELIQNADDAYQKALKEQDSEKEYGLSKKIDPLVVEITYKEDILTISNNGSFFDKEGIKSIVQGNNSTKSGVYIGNKGTGFRSVLNWAKSIRIYSGNFNIEFSKKIADDLLISIKDKPQIKKQIEKKSNLFIPMLSVPRYIDSCETNNSRTNIDIKISTEKLNDNYSVNKQLDAIDVSVLLFLPNASKININTENYEKNLEKTSIEKSFVGLKKGDRFFEIELKKILNGKLTSSSPYYLFTRRLDKFVSEKEGEEKKDVNLSVAIPKDDKDVAQHLYSFFPLLHTKSPFKCYFHATYDLGDQRNNINLNNANASIIKEQLKFLIDVAELYAKITTFDKALQLITPIADFDEDWNFNVGFSEFNLKDYFINLVKSAKIFCSLNKEIKSINDCIEFVDSSFPSFLYGENFSSVIKKNSDGCTSKFIDSVLKLSNLPLEISSKNLLNKINSTVDKLTIKERVCTFVYWTEKKYDLEEIPNLLKNQSGEWIKYGEECCFLDIDSYLDFNLPSWCRIPAMDKEYQNVLYEYIKNLEKYKADSNDIRVPSRFISNYKIFFPYVKCTYRDKSTIIFTVNSSVDTSDKSKEFVKWLWMNFRLATNFPPKNDEIKFIFPNINGDIIDSKHLHLSNGFTKLLFENYDNYSEIISYNHFEISESDIEAFETFLLKFGVKRFPPIAIKVLELDKNSLYYCDIKEKIKKKKDLPVVHDFWCSFPTINNLEKILNRLNMTDIVRWIINDNELYNQLNTAIYVENYNIEFYGYNQRTTHNIGSKDIGARNYLQYVFNTSNWVKIGNEKLPPINILDCNKKNEKFKDYLPVLNENIFNELSRDLEIPIDNIKEVFSLFSFPQCITDLPVSNFYSLINDVAKKQDKDLTKFIYFLIDEQQLNSQINFSENKCKEFIEKGINVLATDGCFYPSKTVYVPSIEIVDKNKTHVLDKSVRTGNQIFINVFGCKKYDIKNEIVDDSIVPHGSNEDFQEYYKNFIQYAMAYCSKNSNIDKNLEKLSIMLVSKLGLKNNEGTLYASENYSLFRKSPTKWYLFITDENFDVIEISFKIEDIVSNIANTPGFDSKGVGELFRCTNESDRKKLIERDFGTLEILSKNSFFDKINLEFTETIRKLNIEPCYDINFRFLNSVEDLSEMSKFIKVLRDANIYSISKLHELGFSYDVDLTNYNKQCIDKVIQNNKRFYKSYLYSKAINNETLQGSFLDMCDEFDSYASQLLDSSSNEIADNIINPEEYIEKHFNYTISEAKNCSDCEEMYSSNYEKLNPENKYADIISNDYNLKRTIYFDKKTEFEELINKLEETVIDRHFTYNDFKSITPKEVEIEYHSGSLDISDNMHNKRPKRKKAYNKASADADDEFKKIIGNTGEILVYNHLCGKYGKENVFPKSEAFVSLGILKNGQEESGGCDIEYFDPEKDMTFFVEVKAGEKNHFFLSPNELEFAKSKKGRYKLFVVFDINSADPKFFQVDDNFYDNEKYYKEEIIEKILFRF